MFRLENDITLLIVGYISLLRCEVCMMGPHIRFPLLALKPICDNKLESIQRQCPLSLALIQNMSCHEILQVFMVWIHKDFMLNYFKQMLPLFKSIHDGYNFFIMNIVINLHKRKLMRTKVNKMKKIVFFQIVKTQCSLQN